MSSKTKTTSTNEEARPALVPKLRFPQFREAEGWNSKSLVDVCAKITQGGTPDTSKPEYWGGSINWMTPAEMGKTESPFINATTRTITELGLSDCSSDLLPVNSVILSVRAPIGHLAINTAPMAINQGCKGLIAGKALDFYFLYCSLAGSKPQLIDLGAGNTFKELSGNALKTFKIPVPQPAEQQKIAECLSSVDELIAAQARKLDALKTHKKGLMQQLFPREGEIQPRLRFPECQERWNDGPLGALCASVSSGRDQRETDGAFDLYGSTGIIGKTASPSYDAPRILVARVGANAGLLTRASGQFGVTDNTLVIHLKPSVNIDYIFYYLGNININNLIFGSGQPLITGTILKNLRVLVPVASEQVKISSCLSSLDELINAQSDKLEALKTHKKGLIQRLFPSSEEAEA